MQHQLARKVAGGENDNIFKIQAPMVLKAGAVRMLTEIQVE